MTHFIPQVSIGMPVYNGEPYLSTTIQSLLGQTLTDFELLISDNASTDHTGEICRQFARQDRRIRYYRNLSNIGAAANYNQVFMRSSSRYFKWAPHDDLYEPTYLEQCVKTLDDAPTDVVLCYPKTTLIDKNGADLGPYDDRMDIRDATPSERLRRLLGLAGSWCHAVVGVIRSDALRKTRLIGAYGGGDNVLLAELALQGQFWEIGDHLFQRRVHEESSLHANTTPEAIAAWFAPRPTRAVARPRLTRLLEHIRAIHRSSLGTRERIRCYNVLWQQRHTAQWTLRILRKETLRAIKRTTWDRYTLRAADNLAHHLAFCRLWVLMSGLRGRDTERLRLAITSPSKANRQAMMDFAARCLSGRHDEAARQLLTRWQYSSCPMQRQAAAQVTSQLDEQWNTRNQPNHQPTQHEMAPNT